MMIPLHVRDRAPSKHKYICHRCSDRGPGNSARLWHPFQTQGWTLQARYFPTLKFPLPKFVSISETKKIFVNSINGFMIKKILTPNKELN